MNISVSITRSQELRTLLDNAPEFPMRVLEACARALAASGNIIVGNSVKYRFTSERGPFPVSQNKLGRVTGRLRQSITVTRPQIREGDSTVSMSFGSNVRYFAVHEFGFQGNVPVRAHSRRGRPVRAHSRAVRIVARQPMTTELLHPRTESILTEQINRQINLAIDALEKGGTP